MGIEDGPNSTEQAPNGKKQLDFSKLLADSHLTKEEKRTISEAYEADKEALFTATRGEIRNFIIKDYGAANYQALGGYTGMKALQKALNVKDDGDFGPDTLKALIEYQKSNGLEEVDAIAGPKTIAKLGILKDKKEIVNYQKEEITSDRSRGQRSSTGTPPETHIETVSAAPFIKKYSRLVDVVENQIKNTNELKKENTGIVGGIGDWIGEKSGAYETGKQIYEHQIQQCQEQAKELHMQIIKELNGNASIPEGERKNIEALIGRLEIVVGSKLKDVSWGKAVFNSIGIDDIQGDVGSMENRAKIFAKTTIAVAEGAYDAISSITEITGKALGILGAYTFDSGTRDIIEEDIANLFSKLTLENAKKVIAILPKVLEEFANASPDVQAEGFGKFIGGFLVPIGIGVKGIQLGKAAIKGGISAVKAGTETTARATRIIARQASRTSGVSKRALRVAGKAMSAGTSALALGTGEAALGTTVIAGGSIIRIAEMDAIPGKKGAKKAIESVEDAMKVAKKEFVTEGKNTERIRKELLQYYHPDKANHPLSEEMTQELNHLSLEMKTGRDVRTELEAIAKDPYGYLGTSEDEVVTGILASQKQIGAMPLLLTHTPEIGLKVPGASPISDLNVLTQGINHDANRLMASLGEKTVASKKTFGNLLDPENYNKAIADLKIQKESGAITHQEYRVLQKELVMERALQRGAEMFRAGEDILRTNPDITPEELTKKLRSHFHENDVELSRVQHQMIDEFVPVLREAIELRKKELKKLFDRAIKSMPEKMEDVQRMLNYDPDVNFEVWYKAMMMKKEAEFSMRKGMSEIEKDTEYREYARKIFNDRNLYQNSEKPVVDILSHPTTIIKYIPESIWNNPGSAGYFVNGSIYIRNGLEHTNATLEHEYTHFLNSLSQKTLETTQGVHQIKPEKMGGEYTGLFKDTMKENNWSNEGHLWSSIQDELLAYIKGHSVVPQGDISPYLNGAQKQMLQEGKISVHNEYQIKYLASFLEYTRSVGKNDNEIIDVIRTSGSFQTTYERLVKKYPELNSPKTWEGYKEAMMQNLVQLQGKQGLDIGGINVSSNINGFHLHSKPIPEMNFSIFTNVETRNSLHSIDEFQAMLASQTIKDIGDLGKFEKFIQSLPDNYATRLDLGDYSVVCNKQSNLFMITVGEKTNTYSSVEELIIGINRSKIQGAKKVIHDSDKLTVVTQGSSGKLEHKSATAEELREFDAAFPRGEKLPTQGSPFGELNLQDGGDTIYKNGAIVSRNKSGVVENIMYGGIILDFKNGILKSAIGNITQNLDGSIHLMTKKGEQIILSKEFITGEKLTHKT